MAKFCPSCGTGLADTAQFCAGCGANLAVPQQQAAQPQLQQPPPPAKKKSNAPLGIAVLVVVALVATGIFTKGFGLFGGGIPVSTVTGSSVTLAKSGKGAKAVKEGAKLKAGGSLATGADTCVYLELDKNSTIKMDENSEISVTEITRKAVKFDLVRGSVLINEKGKAGRLHITAGETLLVVRGTFFTAKYDGGSMVVDLIEGEIDVTTASGSETNVNQGERVTVYGDSDAAVEALNVSNFDAFTSDSVLEFKDALSRGSLTAEDISRISDSRGGVASETDGGFASDGGAISEDGGFVSDGAISEDGGAISEDGVFFG